MRETRLRKNLRVLQKTISVVTEIAVDHSHALVACDTENNLIALGPVGMTVPDGKGVGYQIIFFVDFAKDILNNPTRFDTCIMHFCNN